MPWKRKSADTKYLSMKRAYVHEIGAELVIPAVQGTF